MPTATPHDDWESYVAAKDAEQDEAMSLIERLEAVAAMDLRTGGFLAHTMDTAEEAKREIERLRIEITAIAIYNGFPYDGPEGSTKPAWVPFGNSLKQEEARRLARANASTNGPSKEG